MWFCFNDAFVSVVQSTEDPNILLVRARAYDHLQKLFGHTKTIHISPNNDYRYRVFCTKPEWALLVGKRITDIDYSNFKASVKEDRLHRLYEKFWFEHMIFQNGKNWWKRQTAKYFAEKEDGDAKKPQDGTQDSQR